MTDLVLVRPPVRSDAERHWAAVPPLGLGYLAAAAQAGGWRVRVIDAKLAGHRSIAETTAAIRACDPAMVGLSALTVEYPLAIELARELKRPPAVACVILGGAHANALPAQSLEECEAFDIVVAGEAEVALVEILTAVRSGRTPVPAPGVYVRGPDGRARGVGRTPQVDVAGLPQPAWHLFPRATAYPLMASRGCPYACVFCSHNLERRVRYRPVEAVLAEVEWLHREFHAAQIYFEDETFGLRRAETEQLLEGLIRFNQTAGVEFKAQTRVDVANVKLFRRMRQAGFRYCELGLESGDAEVLRRSGKGANPEQAVAAVRAAREAGLKVWANFIVGLPGETRTSIRNSIDLAVRLNPERLSVAKIVAYPGSQVHTWAVRGENGYHLTGGDWNQFDKYVGTGRLEIEGLSAATLRRLQARFYLEMYLRNRRFGDLLRLLWRRRGLMLSFAGSFLPRAAQ